MYGREHSRSAAVHALPQRDPDPVHVSAGLQAAGDGHLDLQPQLQPQHWSLGLGVPQVLQGLWSVSLYLHYCVLMHLNFSVYFHTL